MARGDGYRIHHFLGIEPRQFHGIVGNYLAGEGAAQGYASAATLDLDGIAPRGLTHSLPEAIDVEIGGDNVVLRLTSFIEQRERTDAWVHRGDNNLIGSQSDGVEYGGIGYIDATQAGFGIDKDRVTNRYMKCLSLRRDAAHAIHTAGR